MLPEYRVESLKVTKTFGGINALQEVTLKGKPGEIHALVGENGAGKSTFVNILSGAYQKDSDPVLDNAIKNLPALNAFLLQTPDTQSKYEEAIDLLMALPG